MARTYEQLKNEMASAIQKGDVNLAMSLADEMRAMGSGKPSRVYLVNITGNTVCLSTNYRYYWIAGKKDGERYAVTPIDSRTDRMDLGDKKSINVEISAEDIGKDLERMANGDIPGGGYAGVFLSYTETPNEAALASAREKYLTACRAWVVEGDGVWARTRDNRQITDFQRRAVRELGIEKEWAYDPKEMGECEGCGEKVRPGIAICKSCGAILNEEKARKLYPERFRDEPEPVAVGEAPKKRTKAAPQTE